MGTYGKGKNRPVGYAGRGKHTGSAGWLGGNHRKDGCLSAFLLIVGIGASAVAGVSYGAVQLVQAVL